MFREKFSLSGSLSKGLHSWCEAGGCAVPWRLGTSVDIPSEKGREGAMPVLTSPQEVGQQSVMEMLRQKKAVVKPEVIRP